MADEPNQDKPLDNLEGEVNDLLYEAESLTSDLTKEVGSDAAPASERETEFFESETDSEASLDATMAQASAAAKAASEEVGLPQQPAAPAKKLKLPSRKKNPASGEGTPTQPNPSAATGRQPSAQQAVSSANATLDTFEDLSDDETGGLVAGNVPSPPFELDAPKRSLSAVLIEKLHLRRVVALKDPVMNLACYILELIDRPFSRIGDGIRKWLGLVALILAVGAVSLLVFVIL